MNRLLGPVGYYYGSKPDRALKKAKLLRQLRQRFPHLTVYPHPAYWEPCLNPKDSPQSFSQIPYFSPGLNFPYVLLKGHALQEARHIRFPYGVFQLRPWRFQPPLFNARLTRRMRRGHFHNVFHKKLKDDKQVRKRQVSGNQVARAMDPGRRSAADIGKLRARLWAETQGYARSHNHQKAKTDKAEIQAVLHGSNHDTKSRDVGRARSKATRVNKPKSSRSISIIKILRPPNDAHTKTDSTSRKQTEKQNPLWNPTNDGSANTNAVPKTVERDALEAIARRKKIERHVQRETERIAREQRKTEDDYLKQILNKANKHDHGTLGYIVRKTRSQRQRALYRKYQEKKKLTEEEQLKISERNERKVTKQVRESKDKKSGSSKIHRKQFPYGKIPPKFQRTPAVDDRFFWGDQGPELRNHTNRTKPNIFRRKNDDILLDSKNTVPPVSKASAVPSAKSTPKLKQSKSVSLHAFRSASKKLNQDDFKLRPSATNQLVTFAKTNAGESRDSSPSNSSGYTTSKLSQKGDLVLKQELLSKLVKKTSSQERRGETKKAKKLKLKCASKMPSDLVFKEQQAQEAKTPPLPNSPETFIVQREELMKCREKAWKQMLREKAKRQKERRAEMKEDMKAREKAVKEIVKPATPMPKVKIHQNSSFMNTQVQLEKSNFRHSRVSSHHTLKDASVRPAPSSQELKQKEEPKVHSFFPAAKNRREAFRAYLAKQLLRIKAQLVFKYRLSHHKRLPRADQWSRPIKNPDMASFDPKNPYLVKVIKNLVKSKVGFRYKYESRAEEFLANFPFVEYTTYRKFPVEKMSKKDKKRYYQRIRKMYRGMKLFKMMTPVRWYAKTKKNLLENPFDNMVYSDAVEEFKQLAKKNADYEKRGDEPGEPYLQFGMYEVLCSHLKTPPFKAFQTQLEQIKAGITTKIDLAGKDLTDCQVRPIALCLMLSQFIECLDISGNLVSLAGACYIAGICGTTENLNQLNASSNQFGPDAAEILLRCLRKPCCKMSTLLLKNCSLGPESSKFIAGIIMYNRSLTLLDLADNHLANIGNNDMFGLAIAENGKLEYLDLSGNGFNEKASHQIFMGAKVNNSLRTIIFSFNHVGEKGAEAISQTLEHTELLHTLFLERCYIEKSGARRISKGISKNESLVNLRLRDNPLGSDGSNIIVKAALAKAKLNNLDLSLCSVNAAFVDNVKKAAEEKQVFIDHSGDKGLKPLLPVYTIDIEALTLKKAKDNAKKKNKEKKKK